METPIKASHWIVDGKGSFDNLIFNREASINQVGNYDCLVKREASSLNCRDLVIAKGTYPGIQKQAALILGSDVSGTVISTGSRVTRFKVGDRVLLLFRQGHLFGPFNDIFVAIGLGGQIDSVFRSYAAATPPCAAATAWNALCGLGGRSLKSGDWVRTQRTRGVSLFRLQFAVAAGAGVIATTSSNEKAEKLKQLGTTHVINYKEGTKWGVTVKALTTGRRGMKYVLALGGPATQLQSLTAVQFDGVISIIGFIAGITAEKTPSFFNLLSSFSCVKGVSVGSGVQCEEISRAIKANDIKLVVDEHVFEMEHLKEACQYIWEQRLSGGCCQDA